MVRWVVIFVMAFAALTGARSVLGQATHGADAQAVDAALADLDAAGTPASATDIADFLAEASSPWSRGLLYGRLGRQTGEPWEQTYRLRLSRRWLDIQGRWRQYRDGSVQGAGAVMLGPDRWRLAVGQLGFSHGYGLLVGAPGRGPALTADGGLGRSGRGLRTWAGAPVAQTLLGVGATGGWGPWDVRLLAGRREWSQPGERVTMIGQVQATGKDWHLAALILSSPGEDGASLAGRWRSGAVDGSWEGTWRRPLGAVTTLSTMLAHSGWRPDHRLRIEIIAGWSDLGPRPVMGQKHPVFGDWAGQGVAVRGTWRAATGLGCKVLIHRGRGQEDIAMGRRRLRTLSDAMVTRTWPGGWRAEGRWRQGGEEVAAWSERFPWQPPATEWRDSRCVTSLKVEWRDENSRFRTLWRRLTQSRTRQDVGWEKGGSRDLLSLTFSHRIGQLWLLRGSWATAWGDAVDLVSAIVPFRGFVLPRHWGHWRSEQLLGLEFGGPRWRCQGAVSWRRVSSQMVVDRADQLAAWLEAGWQW